MTTSFQSTLSITFAICYKNCGYIYVLLDQKYTNWPLSSNAPCQIYMHRLFLDFKGYSIVFKLIFQHNLWFLHNRTFWDSKGFHPVPASRVRLALYITEVSAVHTGNPWVYRGVSTGSGAPECAHWSQASGITSVLLALVTCMGRYSFKKFLLYIVLKNRFLNLKTIFFKLPGSTVIVNGKYDQNC